MTEPFRFPDEQWCLIAETIGRGDGKVREDIESLVGRYRQAPTPDEERAALKKELADIDRVRNAVHGLTSTLGSVGWSYDIRGADLIEELDSIHSCLDAEHDEIRWSLPPNRGDRRRSWLLQALCQYWYGILGRRGARSTDRVTGKALRTPVVAFLMAATKTVFDRHELTEDMAGHAVDEYLGRSRTAKSKPARASKERPEPRRVFHRLPDEFDLVADFCETVS